MRSWVRPPDGLFKCNIDAAVFDLSSHFGFGCIVRNSLGVVVDAVFGNLAGSFSPSLAEALTVREALSWLLSLDFSDIVIESDALVVVEALNNLVSDSSSLGLVVEDCKILASHFSSCHFVFVYRSANQAAHGLPREAVFLFGLLERVVPSSVLISDVIVPDLV